MLLKSKEMALLGVLLGLNQLFIILSSVVETNTIILMSGASLIVGVVIVEFGVKSGILFYAASCMLGFFLTFNKVEIITYILFFGMYSIIKHIIEVRIVNKKAQYAVKFTYFNLSLLIMYFVIKIFITLELHWWMILGGEILFFIYDYAFTIFINYYLNIIRPKIIK